MARLTLRDIPPARLGDFHVLAPVGDEQRAALLRNASIRNLKPGELLFQGKRPADLLHFLVQGELEVQESATVRYGIYAGGNLARDALAEKLPASAMLRAVDEVAVLVLPRAAIDKVVSSQSANALTIEYTPTSTRAAVAAASPEPRRGPTYQDAWMTRMRQSPLLADFSPADVQGFFMELERVPCRSGEDIVTMGQRGDFFYILVEGTAEVLTDPHGAFAGSRFELQPGAHFGEEALIANTPRNATVRMTSDGAIGRLGKAEFDRIFRQSLVQSIDLGKAADFMRLAYLRYEVLDVRTAMEFRAEHPDGARNLPIQHLRKMLAELDRECSYLVAPQGGPRSELAVFLLRQAGLNAYLLRALKGS